MDVHEKKSSAVEGCDRRSETQEKSQMCQQILISHQGYLMIYITILPLIEDTCGILIDAMAERSKATDSNQPKLRLYHLISVLFGGAGSNPARVVLFCLRSIRARFLLIARFKCSKGISSELHKMLWIDPSDKSSAMMQRGAGPIAPRREISPCPAERISFLCHFNSFDRH